MSKKIHPSLIGAFVLGALGLVVAAVLTFGSGLFLHNTREFVLYFGSSVNGLRVGAPVKFRGVEIGQVEKILLQLEPDMKIGSIPVIIQIDADKIKSKGGQGAALSNPEAGRALIDQGLRGQLQMESFVTGLLYVGLDLVPGSSAHFVQPRDSEILEIPTLPTALEKAQDTAVDILARLEEIDFKGLIESVTKTLDGMNRLANAPEFRSAARSFEQTMPKVDAAITSLRDLTIALEGTVRSLSGDLQQTSAETRLALKQAAEAMKQAGETMKRAEAAAVGMQAVVDPDSPTLYELTKSLREVSSAARSLRLLANYLERNPRALIFGKPEAKQE